MMTDQSHGPKQPVHFEPIVGYHEIANGVSFIWNSTYSALAVRFHTESLDISFNLRLAFKNQDDAYPRRF
jgi:hypothetical protein